MPHQQLVYCLVPYRFNTAGNKITYIGKTRQVRIPTDATVIDASGKFLIPGLWDIQKIILPFVLHNISLCFQGPILYSAFAGISAKTVSHNFIF